jgi:hypothetical protein
MADEESLSAIGPDPLSFDTVDAAIDAGLRQAAREIEFLRPRWEHF